MSFKNRIADILVVAARNLAIEISPDAYSFGTNEVAAIIASDGLSSAVDDPRIEFAFDAPGANNERIRLQLVSGNMSGKELAQLLLYSERKDGSEVSQLIGDAQEHFFDVRGSINSLVLNAAGLNLTGNLAIDGVGNQQLQHCQFVSDVGTTTVQAESWLRTTRVA